MNRHVIYILAIVATLTACVNGDDYMDRVTNVGVVGGNHAGQTSTIPGAMLFGAGSHANTRAWGDTLFASDAAGRLDSLFILSGWKNGNLYIPAYEVTYSSKDTLGPTNLGGWDYVNAEKNQSLRLWDFSARSYTFTAYSNPGQQAVVTDVTPNGMKVKADNPDALAGVYLAERIDIPQGKVDTISPVYLVFRCAASKVRMCFYETVPMYHVKDLVFRFNNDAAFSRTNVIISGQFPADGTTEFDVTYAGNNASGSNASGNSTSSNSIADSLCLPMLHSSNSTTTFDFGTLDSHSFISSERTNPTWVRGDDAYHYVFPQQNNTTDARLVANYTLVSDDGMDTIRVKGASVTIPAKYMAWRPNYAYTYIININNKTNGTTGNDPDNPDPDDGDNPDDPVGPRGLKPITFTAIVTNPDTGHQVITEIADPIP